MPQRRGHPSGKHGQSQAPLGPLWARLPGVCLRIQGRALGPQRAARPRVCAQGPGGRQDTAGQGRCFPLRLGKDEQQGQREEGALEGGVAWAPGGAGEPRSTEVAARRAWVTGPSCI